MRPLFGCRPLSLPPTFRCVRASWPSCLGAGSWRAQVPSDGHMRFLPTTAANGRPLPSRPAAPWCCRRLWVTPAARLALVGVRPADRAVLRRVDLPKLLGIQFQVVARFPTVRMTQSPDCYV